MAYVIGVDVGGTFTDAVLDDDAGTVVAAKAPSTPDDYSRGVMEALAGLAEQLAEPVAEMLGKTHHVAHGTTSSLNALVTRNVPPVGFLTTVGHRDSIFIMNVEGRYLGSSPDELQNVLGQSKNHGLIPKRHALEVVERIDRDGNVVVPLDEDSVRTAVNSLLAEGIRSIAVSLLWSFKNPVHERRIRELIHALDPGVFVALSSEVSPRIREFARNATTIMSSQIGPGLGEYLGVLEGRLREQGLVGPLLVMQSNGGAIAASEAPSTAISTVGSVLTGGVVGAVSLGRQLAHRNIITTDVGGTTFLVGLVVDGEPVRASTTIINHHPSTCRRSRSTRSARAAARSPGSMTVATCRSGHAVLSRFQARPATTREAPSPPTPTPIWCSASSRSPGSWVVARRSTSKRPGGRSASGSPSPLGLSVEDAAAAIYAIQNAQTGDLLRKTVVEAGHDPRSFVLYAFGGAGPAYCASYAAEVGVREVVVPLGPVASAFSAYGLASSDIVLASELSDPGPMPFDPVRAADNFAVLEEQVRSALDRQGLSYERIECVRSLDLRYTAQLAEVSVEVPNGPLDDDHDGRHSRGVREAVRRVVRRRHRLQRGAGSRRSPSASGGPACCRSRPRCRSSRMPTDPIRPRRLTRAGRSVSSPGRVRRDPDLRLPRAAARATSSRSRR